MDTPINYNKPLVMHIDLNSCFAIIEQQANPLIRNKPVAIAAYDTPGGMVVASSYEAKKHGIKIGVNVREARLLCKDIIVLTPDPPKYRDAHKKFKKILLDYTDKVKPKSIDEFVIDFGSSLAIAKGRELADIGYEIKQRIRQELGDYITVNVGIGPNRFLAKLAANLHKPDGLDIIDGNNLLEIYKNLQLIDLTGINTQYEARLNTAGIFSPVHFFNASGDFLAKQVFKSKVGYQWYHRLRGWEVDSIDWGRKSFGHQYALSHKTTDRAQLSKLLMKLCEKTGRRLRANNSSANGISLWLSFANYQHWAKNKTVRTNLYATDDIYFYAQKLLNQATILAPVTKIAVTVNTLKPITNKQLGLFDNSYLDNTKLAQAADLINDKYGEFTIIPSIMLDMESTIIDRIGFGSLG